MIDGLVAKHLDWMRVRNLSPLTITARRCILTRLGACLDGRGLLYATTGDLSHWQATRSRTLAPATHRTELSHVRAFYAWVVAEHYRTDSPAAHLPIPRAPRRLPRPIPDTKLAAALADCDEQMRLVLSLAAFAGLRAMEIAGLDWAEVDLDTAVLHVTSGKGGRSRRVPLAPALVALMGGQQQSGPVIRRLDGGRGHCSPNAVTKRANAHLHACGASETLHQLRHRFATATYAACRDIRAVQEMLGHSSPTTTAVYAQASETVSVAAVLAASQLIA